MRYTRKKQKRRQKKATRKRMKGGWPWSKPATQRIFRQNTRRYSRNVQCTDVMESPEIITFIQKYIVNATLRRVKRYNLSLQDLKATSVKFMDLEKSPFFKCIPQDMQKSAETCILNYQSHGGLLVDKFPSTTTPDDIRLIIKSLSAPCAAVVRTVAALAAEEQEEDENNNNNNNNNNDDNNDEIVSDWLNVTRHPLNVANPVQAPTVNNALRTTRRGFRNGARNPGVARVRAALGSPPRQAW